MVSHVLASVVVGGRARCAPAPYGAAAVSLEASRLLADMRAWLDREIADEEAHDRLAAMDGALYPSDRLRTLREVRDRMHWRVR
jgi:hypothetical protein